MRYYMIFNYKFSKEIVMKFFWIWYGKIHIFLFLLSVFLKKGRICSIHKI